MTRNSNNNSSNINEETSEECMQLQLQQQQQQKQQQELVADSQHLNKSERKAKNKPRKKHPVYSNLRRAAKKSCAGDGATKADQLKNSAIKVQDKRDNIVEEQQINGNGSIALNQQQKQEETANLNEIPDSWELLYDLNLLPEKWTEVGEDGVLEEQEESVASDGSLTATLSLEHVVDCECECRQTEDESSWVYDGESKECTDISEQGGVEEEEETLDKKMPIEKVIDICSTQSENISIKFLLHPQQLTESTSGSLRCSTLTIHDELQLQQQQQQQQSETLEIATSKDQLINTLDLSNEIDTDSADINKDLIRSETTVIQKIEEEQITMKMSTTMEVAEVGAGATEVMPVNALIVVTHHNRNTYSECSTQWEGIDDCASTSNDVETVNWSCELHSNEDNELAQQHHECDDPYKNWMERPRRGTLRAVRYKTEMCRTYEEGLPCTYGVRCQFAHGFHELRFQPRHPKHKTELCHMFHSMGICRYGRRCSFVHTENPSLLSQMRFNQQQQQHHRFFINDNHYVDFSGLAISIDKVHSTLQSSCQVQDTVFKNCSDNDSVNYYDVNNNSTNGSENVLAAVYLDQNYSNAACSDDVVVNDTENESANAVCLGSNALNDTVQLHTCQRLTEETQQLKNPLVPINQESITEETLTAQQTTADNFLRHGDQKMVCVVNGAIPPPAAAAAAAAVPWTTNAVLYVPYEACSFHNADGQLMQSGHFGLRNYNSSNNSNNNCVYYGGHHQQPPPHHLQQLAMAQPLQQQQMPPPLLPPLPQQQAVAAYQASNGIVYFNNALQIAAPANTATSASTTTATMSAPSPIVNNMHLYAAAPFQCQAAEPQQFFPGNYYATAAAATAPASVQPINVGNHVNKYFQVVPHLGAAVPYVGNVYYVATAANNSTPAYGNYAYTTNA